MKFTFAPEAQPLDGYTIKRAIHRGGFGEVYYALSDSGKEVALKLLNNNLEVELRGVRQCLNLKHLNLVTIFDIREDQDGDHWIVMEYIGGRGLHETMQVHPDGMPLADALKWLSGITSGLSFLHDRGIVHRDLKPANVFSDQDIVKIGDVGLSKYISESRRSAQTQSVGTVYYMAPEVAQGRYGREVDVYALGIMLVEMLTGHVPFDGETTAEILMKHMTAEPDFSGIPPQLHEVLAASLEKDPQDRIQDVEELERRFRLAAEGMPQAAFAAAAQTASRPQKPAKSAPPKPAAADKSSGNVSEESRAGSGGLVAFWSELPVPVKWIVGGIAAVTILESGAFRFVTSGALWGISVYLVWQIFQAVFGGTPAEAPETPSARPPRESKPPPDGAVESRLLNAQKNFDRRYRRPHQTRRQLRQAHRVLNYTPATPRRIPHRQRIADLTNSLSISLAATFLVTLAVYLTTSLLPQPVHAIYFGSVTMLASWGLMTFSKLREGSAGDVFVRRLFQGTVGLGVGYVALGLQDYLLLNSDALLHSAESVGESIRLGQLHIADGTGYPTPASFMMFFGLMFAARRWWWQSDSFRKSRFRVSSALLTLLVGAVAAQMCHFPGTLGATWALAVSAVIQLSAGWTPHHERRAMPVESIPPATSATTLVDNVPAGEHASVSSV